MTAIYFDRRVDDATRRAGLYAGDIYVYSANEPSLALVALGRELLDEAFGGKDPRMAQFEMSVRDYAHVLARVKPKFIHHPVCKKLIPQLLAAIGCDLSQTHFDVPRMRSATSDGYLTTGIAYAFHPHRDTWYSAPMSQINFWMPMFDIEAGRAMAFHPNFWNRAVVNDSEVYDYQEWNAKSRFNAAEQIGQDTRVQPHAREELALEPSIVVVTPPGGFMMFSAAQMHSTIPNATGQTRFSIDFRTVHAGDLAALRGARNVDSRCTGSAIDDYLRGTDLAHVPAEIQAVYLPGHPQPIEAAAAEAPPKVGTAEATRA